MHAARWSVGRRRRLSFASWYTPNQKETRHGTRLSVLIRVAFCCVNQTLSMEEKKRRPRGGGGRPNCTACGDFEGWDDGFEDWEDMLCDDGDDDDDSPSFW